MPLYEYRCTKCNEITEVLQKFSDAPLKRCCKLNRPAKLPEHQEEAVPARSLRRNTRGVPVGQPPKHTQKPP